MTATVAPRRASLSTRRWYLAVVMGIIVGMVPIGIGTGTALAATAPTFLVGGGSVTTDFAAGADEAQSVTVQSDGKILVAGTTASGSGDFALARYNQDGSLDAGFGTSGTVITDVGSGTDDYGLSVTLQPDGKILVAGTAVSGGNADFALVRYNANGSLDGAFGTGGRVITPVLSANDWGRSVKVQGDGKILVAGWVDNGADYDFGLVRYEPNGSLDGAFGVGGSVITPIGGGVDRPYSLAIQPDGMILVGGSASPGEHFTIVRYDSTGTPDPGFGTGGVVTTTIGAISRGFEVMVQPDNKILFAGSSYSSNIDFALARYNPDGSPDGGFGTGGVVTTPIGSGDDWGYGATLQADGKIVIAGHDAGSDDIALARYNVGRHPDPVQSVDKRQRQGRRSDPRGPGLSTEVRHRDQADRRLLAVHTRGELVWTGVARLPGVRWHHRDQRRDSAAGRRGQ